MKGYRVGQRVHIMRARGYPEFVGRIATVTSEPHLCRGCTVQDIKLDDGPPPISGSWCSPPENLEPIDEEPGDWAVIRHVCGWIPKEKVT